MKAKSRRRLLISSVAMLLVAMLALGTATFAWFTTDKNAYADTLSAKTLKVSTLLLSKSDRAWTSHVNYGVTSKKMYPASSTDGSVWVTTTAADGTGTKDPDAAITAVTGNADYIFKNELNVKNDGTADATDVTLTVEFDTQDNSVSSYVCWALVSKADATDNNVVTKTGTFGVANAAKDTTGIVYQNTAETITPLGPSGAGTAYNTVASTTIDVPDLAAGKIALYDLYVWFEGQDKDCVNANSGQWLPPITFTVDGTIDNES